MHQPEGSSTGAPNNRLAHPLSKTSNVNGEHTGFSHGAYNSNSNSVGGYADRHPRRVNVPSINTGHLGQTSESGVASPQTAFDMQFTPLLPSQLLLGSPFQPGTPPAFASPQFPNFGFSHNQNQQQNQQNFLVTPFKDSRMRSLSSYIRAWFRRPVMDQRSFLGLNLQPVDFLPLETRHSRDPAPLSRLLRT